MSKRLRRRFYKWTIFTTLVASGFIASALTSLDVAIKTLNHHVVTSRAGEDNGVITTEYFQLGKDLRASLMDFRDFELAPHLTSTYQNTISIGLLNLDLSDEIIATNGTNADGVKFASNLTIKPNRTIDASSFGHWTNTPTTNFHDWNQLGNSVFIDYWAAGKDTDNNQYNTLFTSTKEDGTPKYTYIPDPVWKWLPPYLHDLTPAPSDKNATNATPGYRFWLDKDLDTLGSIDLNRGPAAISFSALTTNEFQGTPSKRNLNPYFASDLIADGNENGSYIFSGGVDTNTNQGTQLTTNASRGFNFFPDQHYVAFSSIFDKKHNDVNNSDGEMFGHYLPTAKTEITRFNFKTNADGQSVTGNREKLPSQFLKELKTNPNPRWFRDNFQLEATNALPSTFYNAKLKATANDLDGTITFEFIPGIGATSQSFMNGKLKKYELTAPEYNGSPITMDDWKKIESTKFKSQSVSVKGNNAIFEKAPYAQIACDLLTSTSSAGSSFKRQLKELMVGQIDNIPAVFDLENDIKLIYPRFDNTRGTLSVEIEWRNFYDKSRPNNPLVTEWTKLTTSPTEDFVFTFTDFQAITRPTSIIENTIDINDYPEYFPLVNGQQTTLKAWYNPENPDSAKNTLFKVIEENMSTFFAEVPFDFPDTDIFDQQKMQIYIDFNEDTDHPPSVKIAVGVNKFFAYDETKHDYIYQKFDNNEHKILGQITITGFLDIYPTTIEIPDFEKDNKFKLYANQYTIDDAKNLVLTKDGTGHWDYIKNTPHGFSEANVIIENLVHDNRLGTVSFDVYLDRFYDNKLVLVTEKREMTKVIINNFKKVTEPTSLTNKIQKEEWEKMTVNQLDNETIENIVRSEFKGLVPDATLQFEGPTGEKRITRDTKTGKITVTVTVNKYFDKHLNYVDGEETFTTELSGFLRTQETIINLQPRDPNATIAPGPGVQELNIHTTDTSPTNIPEAVLKARLIPFINFKPHDFSAKNILFLPTGDSPALEAYNKEGIVVANVYLDRWYDKQGLLQTHQQSFGKVAFTGLRQTTPTIMNLDGWIKTVGNNDVATAVSDETLLTIIDSHITGSKPDGWNPLVDIGYEGIVKDNTRGTITFNKLYLKRFYDANGELQIFPRPEGNPTLKENIVFEKYAILLPTQVKDEYNIPNVNLELASDYSDPIALKKILTPLWSNFITNPVDSFSFADDFQISLANVAGKPNPNNIEGSIVINYQMTNYRNQNGLIITSSKTPLEGTLTLTGFDRVNPTQVVSVLKLPDDSGYNQTVASSLNPSDLMKIANQYLDKIFKDYPKAPHRLKINNILIDNVDNIAGQIVVQITYSNYYNEQGLITKEPQTQTLTIEGFRKVKPTKINAVINPAEMINMSPSSVTENVLRRLLINHSSLLFPPENQPNQPFREADIRELKIIERDNLTGKIVFDIGITNYFNDYGNIVYEQDDKPTTYLKKSHVTFNNFVRTSATIFKNKIALDPSNPLDNNLSLLLPSEVNDAQIRNFIMTHKSELIDNLPPTPGFNINHIRTITVNPKNLEGVLDLNINVVNYYDDKGVIQTNLEKSWNLTISGFQSILPTNTGPFKLHLDDMLQTLPSSMESVNIINTIMLKQDVIFGDVPKGFNSSNVSIDKIARNNIKGTISLTLNISLYYDKDGNIVSGNNPLKFDLTLTGLGQIEPTSFVPNYLVEDESSTSASEFGEKALKDLVIHNYQNIIKNTPSTFSAKNIKDVTILDINNRDGIILAEINITNYYDRNTGEIVENNSLLSGQVYFRGFKEVSPTKVKADAINFDVFHEILPTSYNTQNLLQLIELNYLDIFDSLPSDFTRNNILEVKDIQYNNREGEIELVVTISEYFDENSTLVKEPKDFALKLTGFATATPTTFESEVTLTDYNLVPIESLDENDVVNLIYQHHDQFLTPVPTDFAPSNIIFENFVSKNNFDGSIVVQVNYTNYYDEKAEISYVAEPKQLTIRGFKPQTKVTLLNTNKLSLPFQDEVLPQDLVNNIDNNQKLLELVYANIRSLVDNLAPGFAINELHLTNITFNNLTGEITFSIALDKFYNEQATLVTSPTKPLILGPITFEGFKSIYPTIFPQEGDKIALTGLDQVIPSSIQENETLKVMIWENKDTIFQNTLPSSFTFENLGVELEYADNLKGEMRLLIAIEKWYDQKGELKNSTRKFPLTITGFAHVTPTRVHPHVNLQFPLDAPTSMYDANAISQRQLKELIAYNKNNVFNAIPQDFQANNIQNVNVVDINNQQGTMTVTFSYYNYYDANGSVQKITLATAERIVLQGFNTSQPTNTIPSFSMAEECGDFLPSDYLNIPDNFQQLSELINLKKQQIFGGTLPSSHTEPIYLKEITSYNNLQGTLEAVIGVTQYYNEQAALILGPKDFTITLTGFKFIAKASTFLDAGISINNNAFNIHMHDYGESYSKLFGNISPSTVQDNPTNYLSIFKELFTSQNALVQNGDPASVGNQKITINNIHFVQGSANDNLGTLQIVVFISNYWDNEIGAFHTEALPVTLTVNGFKTNNFNTTTSAFEIIIVVLVMIALIAVALLIGLLIAKLPKWRKKG